MKRMRSLRTQHVRDYETKYRAKMYDWVSRLKNKHRVVLKGLDGDFSNLQWTECKEKYGNVCAMCGQDKKVTFDHIVPLSKWTEWAAEHHPDYRANDIENIQPLCQHCNGSKGNR